MVFNWLYLVSLLRILAALGSGVGAEGQAGRALHPELSLTGT